MKPLAIDLFCGLGGWAEGFLSEGYDVIGFDIERHDYGSGGYPGQLVLQDVMTLHGRQFKDAAVIVASPPCQAYSYMAMPWSRAKELVRQHEADVRLQLELNCLFNACFRIAHEAGAPVVVENVKGAQPWVERARWHYGSFYLWGDVPALMPPQRIMRASGNGAKNWMVRYPKGTGTGPQSNAGTKDVTGMMWLGSNSPARKAASAQIAKIPFPLAQHIAKVFKPAQSARGVA